MNEEGYLLLVKGIIERAVGDYIWAYNRIAKIDNILKENPCYEKKRRLLLEKAVKEYRLVEVEKFFSSQYYQGLCDLDGDKMIELIKEKAKKCPKVPESV